MTKRWTAYKMDVKDVANGNYTEDGFVEFGPLQVNRARLMGSVVQKFVAEDDKYGFFILDDGTDTIRIRSFQDSVDLIKQTEQGTIVDVIGRVRKYEDEIYVIPEVVTIVEDPNAYILRKLELKKQNKKLDIKPVVVSEKVDENPEIVEEIIEEVLETPEQATLPKTDEPISPRKKVVDCIGGFDKGEGVEIDTLKTSCGLDSAVVEKVLTELMNEGEIFEPRAGKVKILG